MHLIACCNVTTINISSNIDILYYHPKSVIYVLKTLQTLKNESVQVHFLLFKNLLKTRLSRFFSSMKTKNWVMIFVFTINWALLNNFKSGKIDFIGVFCVFSEIDFTWLKIILKGSINSKNKYHYSTYCLHWWKNPT